jgi:hypothetical protein
LTIDPALFLLMFEGFGDSTVGKVGWAGAVVAMNGFYYGLIGAMSYGVLRLISRGSVDRPLHVVLAFIMWLILLRMTILRLW